MQCKPILEDGEKPWLRVSDRLSLVEEKVKRCLKIGFGLYLFLFLAIVTILVLQMVGQPGSPVIARSEASHSHQEEMTMPEGGCKMCKANKDAVETLKTKVNEQERLILELQSQFKLLKDEQKAGDAFRYLLSSSSNSDNLRAAQVEPYGGVDVEQHRLADDVESYDTSTIDSYDNYDSGIDSYDPDTESYDANIDDMYDLDYAHFNYDELYDNEADQGSSFLVHSRNIDISRATEKIPEETSSPLPWKEMENTENGGSGGWANNVVNDYEETTIRPSLYDVADYEEKQTTAGWSLMWGR